MSTSKELLERTVSIIGLGYVGLPLAVALGKHLDTIGFDIARERIDELKSGVDHTLEVDPADLVDTQRLWFSSNIGDLVAADIHIITVPTPVDNHHRPDLSPLLSASEAVGKILKKGDIVVYESTVYPGCTEEECVPVLERASGLRFNQDFFCGYSPERMNPGDKEHTVDKIVKVTSGSTPEAAELVDQLYKLVVTAGTHKAASIRVAEAAKVIENAQRDLNIAFVNELALVFNKLGIDTADVLAAAGTKWNFLPFKPGLVGGHCIGVDPYYLAYKAESIGYHPELILAGRRLNDNMGRYVAQQVVKLLIRKQHTVSGARVLVMGITFKENCPDIRNSKVVDLVAELQEFGCTVEVYDPHADPKLVQEEYSIALQAPHGTYQGIVAAVAHEEFKTFDHREFSNEHTVVYDLKGLFDRSLVDARL